MTLKSRRAFVALATVLAVTFAAAAAANAQKTLESQISGTSLPSLTRVSEVSLQTLKPGQCKIKPKWIRQWNSDNNRYVWKKIWINQCAHGSY